jgi:hypothetical protein
VEGVNIVKGGGRAPLLSANWADNTIITECMRESGAIVSLHVLSSLWNPQCGCYYFLDHLDE